MRYNFFYVLRMRLRMFALVNTTQNNLILLEKYGTEVILLVYS